MIFLTQQLPSIYRPLDETEEEDGDEIDPPTLRVELSYMQQQEGGNY